MRKTLPKLAFLTAACGALLLLPLDASAQTQDRCSGLVGFKITPAEIGLPSGGATIATAELQTAPADPKTPGATHPFCKVLGAIAPVDPNAPPVNFQVNLPMQWNGKAVQYGGGGFNGVLITGLDPLNSARRDTPTPLARGYATWGTNSGHDVAKLPEAQAFALNDEALINYAYAAYKKTRDAGRRIAIAFYDRAPDKIYYAGSSEGGREGLTMAQRFPADFDGVISSVPVISFTGLWSAHTRNGAMHRNGGWLNPAKVTLLRKAVVAKCDSLDGLADGVIGAHEKCGGAFEPKSLRCAGGADTGDACLSDRQIAAVETLHQPFEFGYALANGVTAYPGWNYGGEDQAGGMGVWVTGPKPAEFPPASREASATQWFMGNGFVRYFIARDANFDPFNFNPRDFTDRVRQVSALTDSTDPDLSAFFARGGKLILKGNAADFAVSPSQGINYYKSVVAKLGQAKVDQSLRFYVTAGANHGGVGVDASGAPIPSGVDLLGELDGWVHSGQAPGELVQVSQDANAPFNVTASRPLCRYPAYPRYKGQGDPKLASSFTCASQ